MFGIGFVLIVLQPQLHNDDAWRQRDLNGAVGDALPFVLYSQEQFL